ncbi:MAG TPA: sigma-54 dependent transcriptional regulator, partial [Ktedonobacterales bacterium]|nr:sigma-54 dependent transcriptional regulator [Ktedonobacterales bacterium]
MTLKDTIILLVEDNTSLAEMTAARLRSLGAAVHVAETLARGEVIARHEAVDLALFDLQLPDGLGTDLLAKLHADDPDLPVIMLTAHANVENAVAAMKLGAVDFLQKPFTPDDLDVAIERAMAMNTLRREVRQLRRTADAGKDNVVRGTSPAMRQVWDLVATIAPADTNVLITGENGTGKEVLACAIHATSRRAGGSFIPVNCGGITETLIEDHLFGHEAHAFTDARSMKRGDFELADKGTIFLDEIGEMPLNLQPNLLRVLDQRRFFRIGGEREIRVDARVIAATNRDLEACVALGSFRQDLYFRLNVFEIKMPALRERRGDIPLLVAAFLHDLGRALGKPKRRIAETALRLLCAYDWPGNVRQLRNVVERALILCQGSEIFPEHLPPELL